MTSREKDRGQRVARRVFLFSFSPSEISPSCYLSSLLRFHSRQQQLNSFLSSDDARADATDSAEFAQPELEGGSVAFASLAPQKKVVDDPHLLADAAARLLLSSEPFRKSRFSEKSESVKPEMMENQIFPFSVSVTIQAVFPFWCYCDCNGLHLSLRTGLPQLCCASFKRNAFKHAA